MSKAQSANEIIEEAKHNPAGDSYTLQIWVELVHRAVKDHKKTMDDKIFILDKDGRHYTINPDACDKDDAYERAMSGI